MERQKFCDGRGYDGHDGGEGGRRRGCPLVRDDDVWEVGQADGSSDGRGAESPTTCGEGGERGGTEGGTEGRTVGRTEGKRAEKGEGRENGK